MIPLGKLELTFAARRKIVEFRRWDRKYRDLGYVNLNQYVYYKIEDVTISPCKKYLLVKYKEEER